MNSLIKLFLDKLSERIFSLIGSSIGTAATTYHAVQQAEQQSLLEDLARKYEGDGKLNLATQLREQAATLANGDPAATGKQILLQVTEEFGSQPRLMPPAEDPASTSKNHSSRRSRRIATPVDEQKAD